MSKRESIYEQKLKMLQEEFAPLDGLSGLNIRLRRFGRCMNLVEVIEAFEKLRQRLIDGEIVMDACIDYDEWCDSQKWVVSKETVKYNEGVNEAVRSVVNRMQDYRANDNNKILKSEVRETIQTSMSQIASQLYLSDDELDEIAQKGITELLKILTEIRDLILEQDPSQESFEQLSESYREMAAKKWFEVSRLSAEYKAWKKKHIDLEVDDLIDYRSALIMKIMECNVFNTCEEEFKWRGKDKELYQAETADFDGFSSINDEILRRYAYLRRIYGYNGRVYDLTNEWKLGKHLYINRETLTDEEIIEFYLLVGIVKTVQQEMVFASNDSYEVNEKKWNRLVKAGYLHEDRTPKDGTLEEQGVLANTIADEMGIDDRWLYFNDKWGRSPDSFRKAYDRKRKKGEDRELRDKYLKTMRGGYSEYNSE